MKKKLSKSVVTLLYMDANLAMKQVNNFWTQEAYITTYR